MTNPSREPNQCVRYLSIQVTSNAVEEMDDAGAAVSSPRAEVTAIEVDYGFTSERLVLQLLLGLPLAGIALYLVALGITSGYSGRISAKPIAAIAFVGALSLVLVWRALHRGPFLRIHTTSEVRKLAFRGPHDLKELAAFIDRASADHGWYITSAIAEMRS